MTIHRERLVSTSRKGHKVKIVTNTENIYTDTEQSSIKTFKPPIKFAKIRKDVGNR